MSHCPSCGVEVAADQEFCVACGTSLAALAREILTERGAVSLLERLDEVAPVEREMEVVT